MKSRDHVNIDSANFLYIVFNNVDGCVIEKKVMINTEVLLLQTRTKKY